MSQVLPLQPNKIESLQSLSLFVDAVQNPIRYVTMIDDALSVLHKLKFVVEKMATVDNAEAYLEVAKNERVSGEKNLEQLVRDFEVDKRIQNEELKRLSEAALRKQEQMVRELSLIEKGRTELQTDRAALAREQAHAAAQRQGLQAKETELAKREVDLKQRSEALKQLVN